MFIDVEQCLCKILLKKQTKTRGATTNFGKEEVLKITFWTSGDIDPIKLNNFGSRKPIFNIPRAQT